MKPKAPPVLLLAHQALRDDINAAAKLGGRTGKTAQRVARLIQPHYAKEEEFALAPLALLPDLAQGTIAPPMAAAITLAAQLHDAMPDLLAERHMIIAALEELMAAAEAEGHAELVGRAKRLMLHEEHEEQVSYPTAILIGKYLQLRLKV